MWLLRCVNLCQLAPGWGKLSLSTFGDYFHDKSETSNCMHWINSTLQGSNINVLFGKLNVSVPFFVYHLWKFETHLWLLAPSSPTRMQQSRHTYASKWVTFCSVFYLLNWRMLIVPCAFGTHGNMPVHIRSLFQKICDWRSCHDITEIIWPKPFRHRWRQVKCLRNTIEWHLIMTVKQSMCLRIGNNCYCLHMKIRCAVV